MSARKLGVPRARDVGHRLERWPAVVVGRGPPEIVDGEGVDARARETDSELFVVAMEPAHVGQDEHRGRRSAWRPRAR